MLISIASGKGGTGKTTLTLLLAATNPQVTLIDCDVEEPNDHLFMNPHWQDDGQQVFSMVPKINLDLCTGCGSCAQVCRFNAITVANNKVLLFDELCHSCGGCILACKTGALTEGKKCIGTIAQGIAATPPGVKLATGKLEIGVPTTAALIKNLKKQAVSDTGDILLDCPPGTACSMVAAVRNSDYCILVTEPNPFGLHDLEQALHVVQLLDIPTGIVINKSQNSTYESRIEEFAQQYNAPILVKIPHSISFAQQYAQGLIPQEFYPYAVTVWQKIKSEGVRPHERISHC